MNKKLIALAVSAGTVAALAGCSSGTASESSGPVDLTMAIWSANEGHLALFDSIADEYVAAHPDEVASVTFETLSSPFLTTLTTQIAGGSTPDMAWIPESSGKEFVESGVLYNLSPTLEEAEGYDVDDIIPASLERWSDSAGDVYGYPFSNSPFGIYVNRGLVEAAGEDQPADLVASGEWTWDVAAEIAAAASAEAGDSVGPITWSAPPERVWDNLVAVWATYAAEPWSADGTSCEFTSPEMTDALTWFNEAMFDQDAFVKPGEAFDFNSGSAAMMIAQLSSSGSIDESIDWDFLPLPAGPEGAQPVVGQAGIGVVAKSDNPDAAADFLAFFTNPENSAKLAQFFPPPRESLLTVETIQEAAPALSAEDIQRTIIDAVPDAIIKPTSVHYSQISPMIQTAFDGLWQPDADVAGVTQGICDQISPIIGG
ncbi:ABC transporter substrate-binding protein [Agromyces sp. SYSU T00194]|uniref:ABC transporter substrate-binding protein n=1 Tax=Agromyces chitinivorans TaxID=3158560 RepID=UPI00339324F9